MRHFSGGLSPEAPMAFFFFWPCLGFFFSLRTLHSLTFRFIVGDAGQQRGHMHPPWTHTSGFRSTLKIRGLRQIGRGPHACQSQSVSLETRVGNQLERFKGKGSVRGQVVRLQADTYTPQSSSRALKYFKLRVSCVLQQDKVYFDVQALLPLFPCV